MSTKHLYNDQQALLHNALHASTLLNPNVSYHAASKSLYRKRSPKPSSADSSKVTLVAGGGAGHEPGHSGCVGYGMLDGAVSGDIFASPSAGQIETCIKHALASRQDSQVAKEQDLLVIINNYTGDILNFGLAIERVKSWTHQNVRVESVVVADDVSVGRLQGGKVGRRGLAGNILLCKILGAGAESGLSLQELKAIGDATVANMASIALSLDHCHVPGRSVEAHESLLPSASSLGMGLHNEPGVRILDPTPPPEDAIREMLALIFDDSSDRGFVKFSGGKDEKVVLFVNNLGGMSILEIGAIVSETVSQLEKYHSIRPHRIFCSNYMTSLNAPGFSITLLNVSSIESQLSHEVDILSLIDATTDALAWSGCAEGWNLNPDRETEAEESREPKTSAVMKEGKVSQKNVDAVKSACEYVLKAEDDMTRYDTIVGDGDCGATWAKGAKGILVALEKKQLDLSANAALISDLALIVEREMGGTSGALLAIYLTGLSHSLASGSSWSSAVSSALSTLSKYTPAQPGDRTLMDALVPFTKRLASLTSLVQAEKDCREGMGRTKGMRAKLGRSVYVGEGGDDAKWKDVPDPGAVGVVAVVEGLWKGLGISDE